MILCDSNFWLALVLSEHPFHGSALRWFDSVLDARTVYFCRATQQSFLRLLTTTAVLGPVGSQRLTNRQAWTVYELLLTDDRIAIQVSEPSGLEDRWNRLALRDTASPKLWMDAYLAAFALAGDYRFVTLDKAFSQFAGLDLVLLAPSSG
jgi:toxin-antitoxin system PIN domain toxin